MVNGNIVRMTIWMPDLSAAAGPHSDRPLATYKAIADAIGSAVADGTLKPGDRLPTHRDLAWHLKVTVTTVTRAYQEARRRGLIDGEVGRGTFVRDPEDTMAAAPNSLPAASARPVMDTPEDGGPVNLSINCPPLTLQREALAHTLADISRSNMMQQLLSYQYETGMREHREAAADWLGRVGIHATPHTALLTCGAQHANSIAFTTLARPGEVILTEPTTYPGTKSMAAQHGVRLEPVAVDEHGLRPDALDEAIRHHAPRALYTMPLLHNPLAYVTPEHRLREIAAVLARHSLPVIEDDVYGLLVPDRPPPLKCLLPDLTIYVTGTSKSMAPGLRVGIMAVPEMMFSRMAAGVRASCWMVPPVMGEVMRRWVQDGVADAITAELRRDVQERRAEVDALFAEATAFAPHVETPQGHPYSYHLWLPLPAPWRAESFVATAQRMGVLVLPGESFAVGRHRPPPAIRLCTGTVGGLTRLRDGIRLLARAVTSQPEDLMAMV